MRALCVHKVRILPPQTRDGTDQMPKRKKRNSDVFDSIMEGLKQAVAYSRGEPVEGVRVHYIERLPDGTVRRIEDPSDAPSTPGPR